MASVSGEDSEVGVVSSDSESIASDVMDSFVELAAGKESCVVFYNVPASFSKQKGISVKFKFADYVVCKSSNDCIGIYPASVNDPQKPLCKKDVLAENAKTGSIFFKPEEIPSTADHDLYYFMYLHGKFAHCASTFFSIDDDSHDDTNVDSSDEDFVVISSQQLKNENDELRNMVKHLEHKLKHKEQDCDDFKKIVKENNEKMGKEQAAISSLHGHLKNSLELQASLTKENDDLNLQVTAQNENLKQLISLETEESVSYQKRIDELKNEITEMQGKLLDLNNQLNAQKKKFEIVTAEREKEMKELELVKQDNFTLKSQNNDLRVKEDEADKLIVEFQRNIIHIKDRLMKTQDEVDHLKAINCELKDENTFKVGNEQVTIFMLRDQLKNALELQSSLAKENEELNLKVAAQSKDLKRLLSLEMEANDEIRLLQEALEKSENMLQAVEASKRLVLETLKAQKTKDDAESEELASYQEHVAELQNEIVEMQEKLLDLSEQLNTEKKRSQNVAAEREEEIREFEMIKHDNLILMERNKALKLQVTESEKQKIECQREVFHMRSKLMKMQEEINHLEACNSEIEKIQDSKTTNEDLKNRLLDGAEIYKQQFLHIRKLEKQVASLKAGHIKKMSRSDSLQKPFKSLSCDSVADSEKEKLKDATDTKVQAKLPEKCCIRFSKNETENKDDSAQMDVIEEQPTIVEEKLQKSTVGLINDSDTGEHVSKLGPNYEAKKTSLPDNGFPRLLDTSEFGIYDHLPSQDPPCFDRISCWTGCNDRFQGGKYMINHSKRNSKDNIHGVPAFIAEKPSVGGFPEKSASELYFNKKRTSVYPEKSANVKSSPSTFTPIMPEFGVPASTKAAVVIGIDSDSDSDFFSDKNDYAKLPSKRSVPLSDIGLKKTSSPSAPAFPEEFDCALFSDKKVNPLESTDIKNPFDSFTDSAKQNKFEFSKMKEANKPNSAALCDIPEPDHQCLEIPCTPLIPSLYPSLNVPESFSNFLPYRQRETAAKIIFPETLQCCSGTIHTESKPKVCESAAKNTVPYVNSEMQTSVCPFCNEIFYPISNEEEHGANNYIAGLYQLWEHLEYSHQKTVCPICGALFDCDASKVFKHHVNSHF